MNSSLILSLLASSSLCSIVLGAPILYYNFDDPGGDGPGTPDIIDQTGTADADWGLGGSANPDSPLDDSLGRAFTSTSAD